MFFCLLLRRTYRLKKLDFALKSDKGLTSDVNQLTWANLELKLAA